MSNKFKAKPRSPQFTLEESQQIYKAVQILQRKSNSNVCFTSPALVKDFLILKFAGLEREEFHVSYLDAQHRLLAHEVASLGTLTQTSVYPREIVKRSLELNASCLILSHNHPSGCLDPSRADELLTQTLKSSLSLVDVRVLDHFIIAKGYARSFAEMGLI